MKLTYIKKTGPWTEQIVTNLKSKIRFQTRVESLYDTVRYNTVMQPMMTSSNGCIFRITGPLGEEFTSEFPEFPSQRPMTRSFDVFFDQHPNKRLSKQSRRR